MSSRPAIADPADPNAQKAGRGDAAQKKPRASDEVSLPRSTPIEDEPETSRPASAETTSTRAEADELEIGASPGTRAAKRPLATPASAPNEAPELARILSVALVLSTAIFIAGLALPSSIATGALYIVPVLVSLWAASGRITLAVAAASTALALLELATHLARTPEAGLAAPLVNTSVAIFAIWVTARLGLWRLNVERDLADSERRTATVFESLAEGVVSVDCSGRVLLLNPTASRLTGWLPERAIGRPLEEVFPLAGSPSSGERPVPAESQRTAPAESPRPVSGVHLPRQGWLRQPGKPPVPIEHTSAAVADAAGNVAGTVTVFRDITRRRRYEDAIRKLAYRDELTGLPNRTSFLDRMQLEIAHARRDNKALALLFLDLNGFKAVNDSLGHANGDRLLRAVAKRLTELLRDGDTVARLGGDEFTILLPGVDGRAGAERVAHKLTEALKRPFPIDGQLIPIGSSVGIALYPEEGSDAEELLERSDASMYRQKRRSRSRAGSTSTLSEAQPPRSPSSDGA